MLDGAVSCDVDTLESIYHGRGLVAGQRYSYAELRMGLEEMGRLFGELGLRTTLFMVGNDFRHPENHAAIRAMHHAGHEIASHSLSHPQGFRHLSLAEQEAQLAGMEELCEAVVGERPVGFRAPGWNIDDAIAPVLVRRGYLYDSSLFPTSLAPLLKVLHWRSTWARSRADRTTMGRLRYITGPTTPYETHPRSLARRGQSGLIEFPVTVTPVLRLPVFATWLLATGLPLFRASVAALRAAARPVHFMFHLSDFVDYEDPALEGQVPRGRGIYIPQALREPLERKRSVFKSALSILLDAGYRVRPLAEWARELRRGGNGDP